MIKILMTNGKGETGGARIASAEESYHIALGYFQADDPMGIR